nr:hypothetical protein [Angustibacter aerolatus]
MGRRRGRRPAAGRARHPAAGRTARGVPRTGARPARRAWSPATPARAVRSPPPRLAARFGLGTAVAATAVRRLVGTGRLVEGEPATGRHRAGGLRRRGAAHAAPAFAGRLAAAGRAGARGRSRALRAGLAGVGASAADGSRWRGEDGLLRAVDQAGGRAGARQRAGDAGAAQPGGRLVARAARPGDGHR